MELSQPWWLLLLLPAALSLFLLRSRSYIGMSRITLLHGIRGGSLMQRTPEILLTLAVISLVIAIAGPQRLRLEVVRVIQSRDILIGVDASRSMTSPFEDRLPETVDEDTLDEEFRLNKNLLPSPERIFTDKKQAVQNQPPRRIDAAQAAIVRFAQNRYQVKAGDRIGVIAFDLDPRLAWPLTDDLKQILRRGGCLSEEQLVGGTNFGENGDGPLDLAARHFTEFGQSKTRVLILVTDGEAPLSPRSKQRLLKTLQDGNIRLYVIGVGPELMQPGRPNELLDFTQRWARGIVFRANSSMDLNRCFEVIDSMERSPVQVHSKQEREPLFAYFAIAGLTFLMAGAAAHLVFQGH